MNQIALMCAAGFLQSVFGTMGSRAGNRNGRAYHGAIKFLQHSLFAASVFSMFVAVEAHGFWLIALYAAVCTAGNLFGAEVSMKIESRLGLKT